MQVLERKPQNPLLPVLQEILNNKAALGQGLYFRLTQMAKEIYANKPGREGLALLNALREEIHSVAHDAHLNADERAKKFNEIGAKYTGVIEKLKEERQSALKEELRELPGGKGAAEREKEKAKAIQGAKNARIQNAQNTRLQQAEAMAIRAQNAAIQQQMEYQKQLEEEQRAYLEEAQQRTFEAQFFDRATDMLLLGAVAGGIMNNEEICADVPGYTSVNRWCEAGFAFLDLPPEERVSVNSSLPQGLTEASPDKWLSENVQGYSELSEWVNTEKQKAIERGIEEIEVTPEQYKEAYDKYSEDIKEAGRRFAEPPAQELPRTEVSLEAVLGDSDKYKLSFINRAGEEQSMKLTRDELDALTPEALDGQAIGTLVYDKGDGLPPHCFSERSAPGLSIGEMTKMANTGISEKIEDRALAQEVEREAREARNLVAKTQDFEHDARMGRNDRSLR